MAHSFAAQRVFRHYVNLLSKRNINNAIAASEVVLAKSDTLARPLHRQQGDILTNSRTEFRTIHRYQGKIKGVVLDWSGTVIDCGVYAPAVVFVEVFQNQGVPITIEEARQPMGMHKRVHIQKITEIEAVRKRWFQKFGRFPNNDDVEKMFQDFVPLQLACLGNYAEMIDGAVDTVKYMQKSMKLKVGSSTGFTMAMVDVLKEYASKAGYNPDAIVAADEVPQARPFPYMVWMNCIRMDVSPIQAVVKVDDTADGVREGVLAGCWSVGLARTGNYVALNQKEINELSKEDYERLLKKSYEILSNAGAHYVIDTINDLPVVIDDINRRLASGEQP
ncbi:phosphonoacetaldehyde hydrolase [Hydra vulgaris]|uniref:phosphonoacetaldehyde hydrolase n=1 Tax=Hydra vulgaris TaxID=6087 RepID=UPI0001926B17|nr:phosphonoacetaldehyde hydrolase [Hydra vulgaris]